MYTKVKNIPLVRAAVATLPRSLEILEAIVVAKEVVTEKFQAAQRLQVLDGVAKRMEPDLAVGVVLGGAAVDVAGCTVI